MFMSALFFGFIYKNSSNCEPIYFFLVKGHSTWRWGNLAIPLYKIIGTCDDHIQELIVFTDGAPVTYYFQYIY